MKRTGPFLRLAWLLFAALEVSLPTAATLADLHVQQTAHHSDHDAVAADAQDAESERHSGSHPPDCPLCQFLTAHAITPTGDRRLELPFAVATQLDRVQRQRERQVQSLRPLPRAPPIS